jgi:hypothetical protein
MRSRLSVECLKVGVLDIIEKHPEGVSNKLFTRKYPRVSHVSVRAATRQLEEDGLIRIENLGRSRDNGLRYYPKDQQTVPLCWRCRDDHVPSVAIRWYGNRRIHVCASCRDELDAIKAENKRVHIAKLHAGRTSKSREKQSETMKTRWQVPEYRERIMCSLKTPECRERKSRAQRERWAKQRAALS